MKNKFHLIIIGFDEIVVNKYLMCFNKAMKEGKILGYSVIELESEKKNIEKRIEKAERKPNNVYYLKETIQNEKKSEEEFIPIIQELKKIYKEIKIYIATEIKSHERYLKYCVENGISCLIEKPIFLPQKNGKFCPEEIENKMKYYIKKQKKIIAVFL